MTLCDGNIIEPSHLRLPSQTGADTPSLGGSRDPALPLEDYLQDIERQEILKALDATHWNRTAAAKKLGMTFRSLRYRLKKLALDQEEEEGSA